MRPMTTTAAIAAARWIVGLKLVATIGIISIFCLAGEARAQVTPDDLEGRWVSVKPALTLDISRCASGWCGVEVNGAACAGTVLRLDVGQQSDKAMRFSGNLQLASESKPYRVWGDLRRQDNGLTLALNGYAGDFPRRTFDFQARLARIDKPSCAPDSKVS
jgi:hypothetical protein